MIKRCIGFLLTLTLFLPLSARALEAFDTSLLYRNLQIITNHVNNVRDSDSLESIMAPGKDSLLGEINKRVANKTVRFTENVQVITEVEKDKKVRLEGTFEAEGNDGQDNWKNAGRNYFTFEKKDGKWLLVDTDFYKALGVNGGGGVDWGALLPWLLLLAVLTSVWFFVLKTSQRKAISRRTWLIIAAIWRFVARMIRGGLQKRAERKEKRQVPEPEIVAETPMEYESDPEVVEIIESAAPSPHHHMEEPEVEVHHFQEGDEDVPAVENKLEHNSSEEKD